MNVKIPKDKYFNIKTKEEMINIMRQPVLSALNLTIDQLFEGVAREGADYNEPKEDDSFTAKKYMTSINTYQTLIDKIKNNEELSSFDYDLIILVCKNTLIIFDNQINSLKEASQELSKIAWKIAHLKLNSKKTTEILQQTKNLTENKN
jgi:hypothetical protein